MILVGKPEGKSLLGRHRHRWADNIKIDLQKVDWIVLAQNMDGWRAVVRECDNEISLSLSLQRHYSPGWSSTSFKSFLHPSRFRATTVQFLHPSLAASSFTPSSQRSLGLPLGRCPPGSLRRTLLDKSSSSWRMTCPAHLSLLRIMNFWVT